MTYHKREKHRKLWLLLILSIIAAVILIIAVGVSGQKKQGNSGTVQVTETQGAAAGTVEAAAVTEAPPATETYLPATEPEADTAAEPESEAATEPQEAASPDPTEVYHTKAKQILSGMTTEEKVAQLFFVTPELLTGVQQVTAAGEATKAALEKYPVGGIVYFDANFVDPAQAKELLQNTQNYAMEEQGLPLFLAVDEEGGRVRKVGNNPAFGVPEVPAMQTVAVGGEEAVFQAADTIGTYLSALGINVDFAPDADVLVNAENTVIGERAFSSDPQIVSDCAAAFTEGLHKHRVLAAYKHFPGHGGTAEDSHTGKAYLNVDEETLRERELIPFSSGADLDVDFIMVSHICLPEMLGDETPTCLSERMVQKILREELGYDGIIITDALQMKAISEYYSSAEAAVKAFLAGCDMLLMPRDLAAAYEGVLAAAEDGSISKERLDASVERILYAKIAWMESADEATENEGQSP